MNALPPLMHETSLGPSRSVPFGHATEIVAGLLSVVGAVIAGLSVVGIVYFLVIDMRGSEFGAHRGLIAFVALPGVLLGGIGLTVASTWWRRSLGAVRGTPGGPPQGGRGRGPGGFALLSTAALGLLLLLGAVGFRAIDFMESSAFCASCHNVMGPQVEAHKVSPHAEVACTKCHIGAEAGPVGPGAGEYIKAKIGGMRQTLSVVLDDYDRPIRAPEGKIPPTTKTCEGCHAPDKDYGVTVRVYRSYLPDEANTSHRRVLAFRVGSGEDGEVPAIHWHATAKVWYEATDESRQTITWAGVETEDGLKEFVNPSVQPSSPVSRRLMDCTDCHNRVGHEIPFPGALVDQAIKEGRMDASLPYLKREALALLGADGSSGNADIQAARVSSPGWFDELRRFYEREYPDVATSKATSIDAAIDELKRISVQTLYPDMQTNWQTYPDNLQHSLPDGLDLIATASAPGCFRCHGTLVGSTSGERIPGTMGGEGCLACHGGADTDGGIDVVKQPDDTQGCALCHVNVSDDQAGLWLADDAPGRLSPH